QRLGRDRGRRRQMGRDRLVVEPQFTLDLGGWLRVRNRSRCLKMSHASGREVHEEQNGENPSTSSHRVRVCDYPSTSRGTGDSYGSRAALARETGTRILPHPPAI